MLQIYYSKKGTPYIWASELHEKLLIEETLQNWFPRMIEYGFVENQDYSQHTKVIRLENDEDFAAKDWAVQIDMAKHIAIVQKNRAGKSIREYLVSLDKKVQDGKLLSPEQIQALFEVCKILGYFTVQKYLEKEHYDFLNKPKNWWEIRAKLLGYQKSDLEEMVRELGIKYKNQRQALFHIDKYELIRMATLDLFLAMGKSEEYAKNIARFTEEIAKEIKPDIYDDTNSIINFKPKEQIETIEKIQKRKENIFLLDKFN